ncbi:MAG: PAS domain-containing protein [Candidatus Marinimicrobia bacterium]|nr:PAS domain-containing protein [Candidatus Neomarinimicrobiota bacterium]
MHSEQFYQSILDNINDIVFVLDTEQRHIDVFGKWLRDLNLPKEHFLGKTSEEILGKEASLEHTKANEAALQGRTAIYEWSMPVESGLRHYQTTVTPLRDNEGNISGIVGVVGVGRDITDEKRLQQDLREKVHLLEGLLQTIPSPIFYKSPDGTYLECNKAFEKMLGLPKEEIIGHTVYDITTPERAKMFARKDEQIVSSGEIQKYETDLIHHEYESKRNVIFHKGLTRNEKGEITAIVGIITDITERKAAERKLEEERQLLQDLMDHFPNPIYFKDRDSKFIRVNRFSVDSLGLPPESLRGKTDFDLFPREAAEKLREDDKRVIEEGEALINNQEQITLPNGNTVWMSATKVPRFDDDGNVIGLMGISLDITAMKEKEAMQQEKVQQYQTLLNTLSEPIAIIDAQFQIQYMNHKAEEIFGYTMQDLSDTKILDIITEESKKQVLEKVESRKKGEVTHYPVEVIQQDGSIEEIHLTASSLFDNEGNIIGSYAHLHKPSEQQSDFKTTPGTDDEIYTICASCKMVQNEEESWDKIEKFLFEEYQLQFSHGLCPDCVSVMFQELDNINE